MTTPCTFKKNYIIHKQNYTNRITSCTLEKKKYIIHTKNHRYRVPRCTRSGHYTCDTLLRLGSLLIIAELTVVLFRSFTFVFLKKNRIMCVRDTIQEFLRTKGYHRVTKSQECATRVIMVRVN